MDSIPLLLDILIGRTREEYLCVSQPLNCDVDKWKLVRIEFASGILLIRAMGNEDTMTDRKAKRTYLSRPRCQQPSPRGTMTSIDL